MNGRRRVLRAGALAAFAWSAGGRAQDPRSSSVQAAARDFLKLTDSDDGGATWDAAGAQFKKAISRDRWSETLKAVRDPFGPVTQRSALSTTFPESLPGAPAGEYSIVLFRTSFAKRADSRETVTLQREADGAWRVVGYAIQ